MKYVICALIASVISAAAYARCTTQSVITPDGRAMVCTTCCDNYGNCNTTCV